MRKITKFIFLSIFIVGAFFILLPTLNQSYAQDSTKYSIKINKTFSQSQPEGKVIVNNDYDFRVKVFDTYFQRGKSPLEGYGKDFLKACEKYGAPEDCTLLPAIGYIETRNCTLAASDRQKNCWGWGGAGENRVVFPDYSTAIDQVTQKLMTIPFYKTEFFNDPVYAQYYYCGQHCDKWGTYVQQARQDINNLSVELGYRKLF
ncbi:hypothetical protein KC675_04795 [Candidatus Dojkabacteria bacterium]|uniref:Mannosyl-glycoprotein endo-beta-N-acetylglucosamidase-like domain-containing protein n=1 Tax=Candidatus Dojkabacteria bacterium TaxID=2099670 RepID=A0A955I9Q2_9BACT|nr:hypothetical protein [Candidatus Dojkabacteria bacterium]